MARLSSTIINGALSVLGNTSVQGTVNIGNVTTLANELRFNYENAIIKYKDYDMIKFQTGSGGHGISIGGGGRTIIGSGESIAQVESNTTVDTENLYAASDGEIKFITNLQSGWASGKTVTLSTTAHLEGLSSLGTISKIITSGSSGSWASLDIEGSKGGFAGFKFTVPSKYFMVGDTNGYSGIYNGSSWEWAFVNGTLTNGTVPWARITGQPTSYTGLTNLSFASESSDGASIRTVIESANTYFDFYLADNNNGDKWRWRFYPTGGTEYSAMELRPVTNTTSDLYVTGDIYSGSVKLSGFGLGRNCTSVTDWNDALATGWYMGQNVTNAPDTAWYMGEVIQHNTLYVVQTIYAFTATSNGGAMKVYRRVKLNGTWGSWTNITVGDISYLNTTIKTNAVDAINEVNTNKLNLSGGTMTGSLYAPTVSLVNNSTDTFNNRFALYNDTGVGAMYGMMLWNTSGTSGEWATMIYGPNQANRRISFGKVNTNNPTNHSHVTEGAYFDLDDWSLRLTANAYVNGSVVWNAGNDGSGSGLDADLLDGNQASAFVSHTQITNYSVNPCFGVRIGMGNDSEVLYFDDTTSRTKTNYWTSKDNFQIRGDGNSISTVVLTTGNLEIESNAHIGNKISAKEHVIQDTSGTDKATMQYNSSSKTIDFIFM